MNLAPVGQPMNHEVDEGDDMEVCEGAGRVPTVVVDAAGGPRLCAGDLDDTVTDEADLEEVDETAGHLLDGACARARHWLMITGRCTGSKFLDDLR